MKPAANLSLLWQELPYLDRFDAAATAGFRAVEVAFPYEVAAKETQMALGRNGLSLILINAPPPNYTGGPRGFAAQPENAARFQSDMRRAIRYARALGVKMIHVMAGEAQGQAAHQTFVSNMQWAAQAAPKGLTLMIKPMCTHAAPGYFVNDYAQAAALLEEIGAANVALQFDSFHAQMIHGDAVMTFEQYAPLIRHVQIADAPDRAAPGTGEVNFAALFAAIRASGYSGWIAGAYEPLGRTDDSLNWIKKL